MPWEKTTDLGPPTKPCRMCGTMEGEFYRSPKTQKVARRCRRCHMQVQDAKRGLDIKRDDQGRIIIRGTCGHDFPYRIKQAKAIEWLKDKPCPKCRRKPASAAPAPLPMPQQPAPTPAVPARPEPDDAWVDSILAMLPKGELFHKALPDVMMLLGAESLIPVWLQGPSGTSKSTLAHQAATGLGLGFYPISCHELMTRSDLFGFTDANGIDHRTPLWEAFEKGGVCLLDEVDNGNPNLIAALNSALSNGHCVLGSGTLVQRHPDFRVVATANTAGLGPEQGFIGRNGVDLATRDRFVTIEVLIDDALELALAELHSGTAVEKLAEGFVSTTTARLRDRSRDREELHPIAVVQRVQKVRSMVDSRFRGFAISPRVTIHVTNMLQRGFTFREAITAKLPGLKKDEVEQVLRAAMLP